MNYKYIVATLLILWVGYLASPLHEVEYECHGHPAWMSEEEHDYCFK